VSSATVNDQAVSVQPASSPPALARAAAPSAPLWHLGWAVGALAAAAALMAALGALSSSVAGALALGAAPGLLGYFWQPAGQQKIALLAVWTVAVAAAAAIAGGITGPLAVWCAAPVLAGALIGKPAEGVVLSACAAAVMALVQLAGVVPPPPTGPFGIGLAAVGLVSLGGAAAGAMGIMLRRARDRQAAHGADQAWMHGVMAELPYLAVALGRDGRAEAVFGAPMPGLGVEALQTGLVQSAAEADRATVKAALCEALDHGTGEAVFSPAAAPERRMVLALRRRGEEGLVALIRDVDAASLTNAADAVWRGQSETRIQALENTVGLARWSRDQAVSALVQANGAREAAALAGGQTDTRVQALENSYRIAVQARDQALKDLAEARAARAAAETARQQADAGAVAKSRFLANMSHELRTPLNAIMGFSDIMRARMFGELSPKYGEYAELIHESGRHLTDLINDVLDMSKIEAERYTLDIDLFDAREPVSGALRLMRLQADEAGVQLRGVLPQAATLVDADRRALKQIVLNLVSNALKFTPTGGSITVTLQAVGEVLELVVADTGVGIAKEDLDRLGQPYEQAGDAQHKAQGTGLGLSLVRAFARLHGGEMSIESELGEGAAVTVRLPVLHEETPQLPLEPAPAPAQEDERLELGLDPELEAAEPSASGPVEDDALATQTFEPPLQDDAPRAEIAQLPKSAEIIPLNLPRA
jgi:cell cycle sensor histidine kinase DivJ